MSGPFYDPLKELQTTSSQQRRRRKYDQERADGRDWFRDLPDEVGKHGKRKNIARLGRKAREQEQANEEDSWFDSTSSLKIRGLARQGKEGARENEARKTPKISVGKSVAEAGKRLGLQDSKRRSLLSRMSDEFAPEDVRVRGGRSRHDNRSVYYERGDRWNGERDDIEMNLATREVIQDELLTFQLVIHPHHLPMFTYSSRSAPVRPSPANPLQDTIPNPITQAAVSLEYSSLRNKDHCPLGMYVVPSAQSLTCWDAVFFVHRGYYAGAILKFRLNFPSDYPEHPPVVRFVTDVFHPLIAPDGIMSLAPRFRPWRPKEHAAFHVLAFIKTAFTTDGLDKFKEVDSVNKEAFKYQKSPASFDALAKQSAMLSQSDSALFDSDHPSLAGKVLDGITFRDITQDQLEQVRTEVGLQGWNNETC
ncbi:hypothetical protein AX17_001148 [Amanita inopinata Kibby_2008]|nr:hypothetical protein AX17_001148 [Amanita inopinata Kibby_2008]